MKLTKEMRRAMKKRAKIVVKNHYLILVFICLLAVVFGTDKTVSNPFDALKGNITSTQSEQNTDAANKIESYGLANLINDLLDDQMEKGSEKTKEAIEQYKKRSNDKSPLGRSRGVFADLVNKASSGQAWIMVATALNSITHSEVATSALVILGALVFVIFVQFFIRNVFSVMLRRMIFEARTYEKVPVSHTLSLLGTGQWINVALAMALTYIRLFFWTLTIIGGFIKSYSYWMVEYILAENPSVKPRQAILLSRRMMNGHKWEAFKYQLSYILWFILSAITFGISDIIFGLAYRHVGYAEYAAYIRQCAIDAHIEGVEVLNDDYLFTKPDAATLQSAYTDTMEAEAWIKDNEFELKGIQKFFSEWFGIWIGSTRQKRAYQKVENKKYSLLYDQTVLNGDAYPYRLNDLFEAHKTKDSSLPFIRNYTIWSLLSMFLMFAFVGWAWEVALTLVSSGKFVNRGMLHGPWLPIYGEGLVLILIAGAHFRKKPILEFIVGTALCGCLEYYTAFYMWTKYHKMWWDYTGYFLNLHGRICAEGLLVFGLGGLAIVYLIAPLHDTIISYFNHKIFVPVVIVLMVVFGFDYAYSQKHPNEGKGVTDTNASGIVIQYDINQP